MRTRWPDCLLLPGKLTLAMSLCLIHWLTSIPCLALTMSKMSWLPKRERRK